MHCAYLKQTSRHPTQFLPCVTRSLPCHVAVRLVAIHQEVSVRAANALTLSSFTLGRRYSLVIALHMPMRSTCRRDLHEIFKNVLIGNVVPAR